MKKYKEQFHQFLHAKTATSPPEQFLKSSFFAFRLQWSNALGMMLAKTALSFIYSKNMKFYRMGLQQISYLLFKGQVYKNIPRYYNKHFKITSLSQYWWHYCQIWKCICLLRLFLEITKPWIKILEVFERIISGGVFFIVKPFTFHCNFTCFWNVWFY